MPRHRTTNRVTADPVSSSKKTKAEELCPRCFEKLIERTRKCEYCKCVGCTRCFRLFCEDEKIIEACFNCFLSVAQRCSICEKPLELPYSHCQNCHQLAHYGCMAHVQQPGGMWGSFAIIMKPTAVRSWCKTCFEEAGYRECECGSKCAMTRKNGTKQYDMVIPEEKLFCDCCKKLMCFRCSQQAMSSTCAACLFSVNSE